MKVTCPNCAHTFDTSKRSSAKSSNRREQISALNVWSAFEELERLNPRDVLHRVSDWRARTGLPKDVFDRLALELERAGRITLHFHDYAASMPAAEREAMVTNGTHFFHAVARRRGR